MNIILLVVVGILIAMVIGLVGIYLVPKMTKEVGEGVGFIAMWLLAIFYFITLVENNWEGFFFGIGSVIGFLIPLFIGSYLITIIKRSGTTEFNEAVKSLEMQSALIANAVLGFLISVQEWF